MDYLDPEKERRHRVLLFTGYLCIAVAIVIATLVLLYQAYGFGIGKNGTVIQNGLVFFSSQPNPAQIYINGKLNNKQTNTRLVLPENIYHIELKRSGYRTWQRTVELDGGSVQHFDYPFLFPQTLTSTKTKTYDGAPALATQSLDRRWAVVEQPGSLTNYDVYDLNATTKVPTTLTLPDGVLSDATAGTEHMEFVEWADDNQHLLLQHFYNGKSEYILVDRSNPGQSINLTTTLSLGNVQVQLEDKKYDHYTLYDQSALTLQTTSLKAPTPVAVLEHVLAFHTDGTDTTLYVTDANAPTGKVNVILREGTTSYVVRTFTKGGSYLVDLAQYNGTTFVAAGSTAEGKVYVYRDPVGQLSSGSTNIGPAQVLRVDKLNYLSFSTNAQFIVAEGGQQFGVYDNQNSHGFNYTAPLVVDAPQAHVTWMDGDRLTYVSGGKLVVFDYDHTNQQTLMAASPAYPPFFTPNYRSVETLTAVANSAQTDFDTTSLITTP